MTSYYPIVIEEEANGAVSAYAPGLPVYAAADSRHEASTLPSRFSNGLRLRRWAKRDPLRDCGTYPAPEMKLYLIFSALCTWNCCEAAIKARS